MATRKYWSVLTTEGKNRLADAALSGNTVGISHMAVGDGGGISPEPHESQIALVNEQYRARLNRLEITDVEEGLIRAELIIPSQVGGFSLREAGLFSDDGVCLAVSNLPEIYKPLLDEGAGRMVAVNIWLRVNNTENVQLIVDPSIMLATVGEVNQSADEMKTYTNDAISGLDEELKMAIADAVRDSWENDNPPGTVKFYAKNINPNLRYPGSEWVYTGENKTIRVAKSDGSNVGETGGNDTVTLSRDNLPSVEIDVSGETSTQAKQSLKTNNSGKHRHGGVPSRDNPYLLSGDRGTLFRIDTAGETDDGGEHQHDIDVPEHKHSVTAKTAKLGSAKPISIVESHILLMCWLRVA